MQVSQLERHDQHGRDDQRALILAEVEVRECGAEGGGGGGHIVGQQQHPRRQAAAARERAKARADGRECEVRIRLCVSVESVAEAGEEEAGVCGHRAEDNDRTGPQHPPQPREGIGQTEHACAEHLCEDDAGGLDE